MIGLEHYAGDGAMAQGIAPGCTFVGTALDAAFVEATIDPDYYASTPVPDGCTTEIESLTFNRSASGP